MIQSKTNPIVILGAGFTGLFTALHLSRQNYDRPIVLIDRKERFTFQPLLYEFFSEEMSTTQVCPPYEELLSGTDVTFVRDTIEEINLDDRQVNLASGLSYTYENLVLALGSAISYFGVEGAKEHSWPFRTHPDAQALQQHLRDCLQRAVATDDRAERRRLLTVALVGGGPAGVELGGTLGDLLPRWYAELGGDPEDIRLLILERDRDILQEEITAGVRDIARESLPQRQVPVELCFNSTVTKVEPHRIEYKEGEETKTLETETLLWTAGVCAHPLVRSLPLEEAKCDRFGRPKVLPTLQLPDYPEVFAGGDCAAEESNILPPLAQVAYQEGAAIADNLVALSEGKDLKPAEVNLRGALIKLGLNDSAAKLFGRFEVSGKIGHLVRHGTYLQLLPTPVHNLKASAEWLIDEIFERYSSPVKGGSSSK